ncbi:iron uptake system protein EfeO [Faucicola boevrei]|uniref:iron uptake system protein EfeO n=1 Tax=Faucicola boevrei TaxID=346665 RepID=UPI0003668496|nr:iron uptake system protein EfeO [Moraxella boevrei]
MKKSLLALAIITVLTACQKPTENAQTPTNASTTAPVVTGASTADTDLSAETTEYKKFVEGQIDQMLVETEKFVALLKAGKTEEAKALYPHARMYFERSEPIAESFGDLDPRIDNREADLEKDEVWTGFHAIEKILWTKNTTKGTEALGDKLIADVKELRAKIPTADVTPELMVQGSVDLLNEVSTTKITGEEEIFSKTDLYDFKANIEGAEKIFQILTPKLQAKNPELVKDLTQKFADVNALLDKQKVGEKDYKLYDKLAQDEIKALAEAVNKLGEPLAQMGIVMQ